MTRYMASLYFQDLETGDFRTIDPRGLRGEVILGLLADPEKQFAPVPPPPPPPPEPNP